MNGGRKEPSRFRSAWPLAERYEAIVRAFNEPALYAQRLARRLYAQPWRAIPFAYAVPDATPCLEIIEPTQRDTDDAVRHFNSS